MVSIAPCKGIQDSLGFCIPRRGFRIPGTGFQSLSAELGFWIPIVSMIPDSGFLELYSGFQSPGFLILRAKISRFPESLFSYGSYLRTAPLQKYLLLNLSFDCFLQAVSLACFTFSSLTFINQISPHVGYRSGFRDPGIFAFGIRNPENSCLLDSKSWALESAVHVKESGIPLTIGIPNPSST